MRLVRLIQLSGSLIITVVWPLIWLVSSPSPTSAQAQRERPENQQPRDARQLIFDHWESAQGLPNSAVQTILQTREGYLWVGAEEGLSRFDGTNFTTFSRRTTAEIKHNNIQALIENPDGSLWIGSLGGLLHLKDGKFTSFTTREGLSHDFINCLYKDHQGILWIGTYGGGLNSLKNGQFTHYTTRTGLASDLVTSLAEDHDGNLWVGTQGGLDCLKNGKFIHYTTGEGLISNQIWSLRISQDRTLWIGTSTGAMQFKDGKFLSIPHGSQRMIKAIYQDASGVIWIGTYGGGLELYSNGKLSSISAREGLSSDFVLSIYQDREGNIWVGTQGGGLNRLRDDKFITYTTKEGLADDAARVIAESRDGSTWIGTFKGVSRFKDGKFTTYTVRNGLPDEMVLAIFEDHAGQMWFGSNGGLSRFKDGHFTNFTMKDGLSHNMVRAIAEDREGGLWIGTRGGLDRFKDGKFINQSGHGFPSTAARMVYLDRAGQLWIGGNSGLSCFKNGEFTTYTTQNGMSHSFAFAMIEDHDEDREPTYWIGTYGGGLNRFKHGKFVSYTAQNGLFDDTILQILEDGRGNLWMSCSRGVFRVSKQELNDYADGKIKTITSISYGASDGMKSAECNGSSQPAGWKTRDGRLWFPTAKGVAIIDPDHIKANPLPPLARLESILADDRKLVLNGKPEPISFAPGISRIEISYSGISLSAPEKIRFRYQLEGFDQDWIDAGSRRVAYYTNLSPGTYRFKIMTGNNDGIWNEAGVAYEFELAPYFYQRSWFYLLCATLIAGAALAIHRIRVSHMQARFTAVLNERNRIAREIHDTLIQGVVGASTLLGAVSKMLDVSPQQAHAYLEIASTELKKSLDEARVAVGGLREQVSDINSLPDDINGLVKRLTAGRTISAQCIVQGKPQPFPDDVAENLLRIGREAISNAIRHSAATRITVRLHFEQGRFELLISDDGVGFDPEELKADHNLHFGLLGMRERAEVIGGELTLESHPGAGTTVSIRVPINNHPRSLNANHAK